MVTMTTPEPSENPLPPSDRKAVIEELNRGRDFATRLAVLLLQKKNSGDGGSHQPAAELAGELVRCLSRALAVLELAGESPEMSQLVPTTVTGITSPFSDAAAGKRKIRPVAALDRRGGPRRRGNPCDRRTVTSKSIDDKFTWRKYGQKEIHSAKFPRSYYRCTHKFEQGCVATRQVQKSEADPSLFLITYMGHHTCSRNNSTRRAVPVGPTDQRPEPSYLISFAPSDPSDGREQPPAIHPSPPLTAAAAAAAAPKPEFFPDDDEADVLSNLSRYDSSSEYLMLPDIADLGGVPAAISEVGDVTSAPSSGGLEDMEFDFIHMFEFDRDDHLDFKFP